MSGFRNTPAAGAVLLAAVVSTCLPAQETVTRTRSGAEPWVQRMRQVHGVHPSNPRAGVGDFSEEALSRNGYSLRNYVTLRAYAEVIEHVLQPPAGE
ncbi:MAG TPA: hypothetical protein VML55_23460 [Planctomycetaceae bacterium]|nr:hypothetical protein [Planctomycetaceae bacterium]